MRPIPARKHHWAVLIILAVVAINTLVTFRHKSVTGAQANMLAEVYKCQEPGLYGSDGVFADTGRAAARRLHLPAWQAILATAIRLVGPDKPINALRLICTGMLLLYLLGMYVLLYRQTHSTSAATLVAAVSMAIFSTRRPFWGMGPLFAVTPASLYLAFIPLLALAFIRLHKRWSVLGVFFVAGLCGNIHLASAVNLTIVMFVALLGLGRFKGRACEIGFASLSAATIGASPAIYYYYDTFVSAGVILTPVAWQTVRDVLQHGGMNVLYPGILTEALRWLPVAGVLIAPAAIVLGRAGRYRAVDPGGWLWLPAAAIFTAFGLYGLMQLAAWWFGNVFGPSPVIYLFGAFRLVMLALYVLAAHALVHLLRMARTHQAWVRAAAGLFAAVYLGSSYNTRPIRHMVRDMVAETSGKEASETARHNIRLVRDAELREIATWVGQNTGKEALFLTGHAEIRLYGRRSILAGPDDLPYLLHLAPQRLKAWHETLQAQRKLLTCPEIARPEQIIRFAETFCSTQAPTYILIPAAATEQTSNDKTPKTLNRLKEIAPPNRKWGRHWRLFRILPQTSTTTRAATATTTRTTTTTSGT